MYEPEIDGETEGSMVIKSNGYDRDVQYRVKEGRKGLWEIKLGGEPNWLLLVGVFTYSEERVQEVIRNRHGD